MKDARILIVDDDPQNMELILKYFEESPAEIFYAPNGQRAVELARLEIPDLILMDWEMPVLDGIGAVKILQADPETSGIPIIINSGVRTDMTDLQEALDIGAVDFLNKPFNPLEFNARVRANLRLKKQHETIANLLKENLERKERELTKLTLHEHEKNQLMQEVLTELQNLKPFADERLLGKLGQIQREIRTKLSLTRSWDKFTVHFEEVHPDFFRRLREAHSSLSQADIRMCAYLKIQLDNKEIALLTNIESASVRKALMRLKKKLNLSPETHLRDYMHSI